MKEPGSLGGRDDVFLPSDLPDLPRFWPADYGYTPAEDLGRPDEFPTRGYFVRAEPVPDDTDLPDEIWVAVTEGLDDLITVAMEDEGVGLTDLTIAVDTAEKAGDEETSSWRYTASIVPADELGPPED